LKNGFFKKDGLGGRETDGSGSVSAVVFEKTAFGLVG